MFINVWPCDWLAFFICVVTVVFGIHGSAEENTSMFSNIWPGDWSQFLASIVATVIGIFGPFYLQSVSEKRGKKKRAIQFLRDIDSELNDVARQLRSVGNDIYINPIKTPMWDSLINTNEIQLFPLLKSKKNSNNMSNLTKQLFRIYGYIGEYNSWWNMYSQGAIIGARSKEELKSIKSFIDQTQQRLLCEKKDDKDYSKSIRNTLDIIEDVIRETA